MPINLNDYDIILKVCDFKTRSKSARKFIDKESVAKLLRSPEFIDKMNKGRLLGLFTHKGRQPENQSTAIPYEDNIAISPYLCNVTMNLWIDGDELHAGVNILKDTDYGKKLVQLIKSGILVPVSMSVKAHSSPDKYYIDDFYGIDFTFRPDLEAEVLNVNFSCGTGTKGTYEFSYVLNESDITINDPELLESSEFSANLVYSMLADFSDESIDFTVGTIAKKAVNEVKGYGKDADRLPALIKEIRDVRKEIRDKGVTTERKDRLAKLQNEKKEVESRLGLGYVKGKVDQALSKSVGGKGLQSASKYINIAKNTFSCDTSKDFSIKEYLVEGKMKPQQVLRRRIYELIQFIGSKKQSFIDSNSEELKQYINGYIMKWIQFVLNNPEEEFNISMGLRLTDYVNDRNKLIKLQRLLTRARDQLLKSGSMQLQLQRELNVTYQDVLNEVYSFINHKLMNRGVHL